MDISVNKDVIVYEENNEIILVNMIKNNFYALDHTGSEIWKKIELLSEVTKVIDSIFQEFDGEREVIKNEIMDFIFNLEKAGVIEIIVMDNGNIVEEGNYDELMNKRGVYYEMYLSQAKWYEEQITQNSI
ncbi:PqqD family protein [Bacillus sp. ES1-5]|uniref:PqqD family protein n=1 Tax=Bacillus sp. ES1-5 TaxID=1502999 RepID=UPI001F0C112F|nr:PqqD family peptide modification chaperone [Bacillus sp. ES1-5]